MPIWMRVVATVLLLAFAVVALIPLAYAGYRYVEVPSGEATRYGVRVDRNDGAPLSAADADRAVAVLGARLGRSSPDAIVGPSDVPGESVEVVLPAASDSG